MIPPRPEVAALLEAVHGTADLAELVRLRIDPVTLLDFSTNISPFGSSPSVLEAIRNVAIDRYPDREATLLRQALAEHLAVPIECTLAGNGSSELLLLIALAYLQPDDAVVIVGPTYGEYARVAKLMGARVIASDATAANDFETPSQQVADALRESRPRVLFLCRPNNPTGQIIAADIVKQWLDEFPQSLFVVDEAYLEFSPAAESLIDIDRENLVILRSLTKAYGLAGLRLGYAVGHADVIRNLSRVRPPWSVNSFAQAAGSAALGDLRHVQQSVSALLAEKAVLIDALNELLLAVIPTATHYFLVRVPHAAQIRRELLAVGILVRDCTSFGLPGYLRISPRHAAENQTLCAALTRILTQRRGGTEKN